MKIGLSYSRCIRDIVEGRVMIEDVLVIIARTNFDPHEDTQWHNIWMGYTTRSGYANPEWADYSHTDSEKESIFRRTTIDLYDQGKLHQPRKFGSHPHRLPYYWLEAVLTSDDLEKNAAAQQAFEQFKIIAGLTNVRLDHQVG